MNLQLHLPAAAADHFVTLFSAGVGIKTIAGIHLIDLLCDQLGIARNYIEQRIQTIFLNHRAVDRTEQVIVPAGAVLALSAAMPGLVGATFRKGGAFSAFRKDISYLEDSPSADSQQETLITLKLFNLVAEELGPPLLSRGVWIDGRALASQISRLQNAQMITHETCWLNGRCVAPAELRRQSWPEEWVAFSVVWTTDPESSK